MTTINDYKLSTKKRIALELARAIRKSNIIHHPLRQLFWECTLRCNMHCRHCGSDCKKMMEQHEMPREDFFRVLDSVARRTDPKEVFVEITGGEPLMRDDLEECGRGIHERGFTWGMVTNGYLLTPERFQSLRKAYLYTVAISLDGLEEDHNWMRGHREGFAHVNRALDILVADPLIKFDVVTCVNRRNYPHLSEIRDFLIAKGVKDWRLFSIFPSGRAANDPLMLLKNEEYRGMLNFIKHTRSEGQINTSYGCSGFIGNYEGEVRDHPFSCQAGITVGSVMADGAIAACASIRADYNQGNIYDDDFMDVWENRYHPHRTDQWKRTGECATCKFFRYCHGNSMHLRDNNKQVMVCHIKRLLG
ncbi:MAG: TIGR04133 family radical SAM/SPASM protein [Prevotella sp.]|uniref:TIGR04133 family radical SAM/SPASM protein n=1 Tax=Prevotella sp. TaxID=59823 RepID=UPI002A2B883A|nr:TIGR04133 family radical SAM/SPASM protein [Prevotella sp.]MDD7319320.1 TIGR04133 family radical SAM/SPASM protein [Prevotellaceae bacterium]MDY4020850.1 TIGR04133 family radical SAM/SPASM protein [Prevotella sp.]